MRVLMVDDEPLVGSSLVRYLKRHAIDLDFVTDSELFWTKAKSDEHRVIALDECLGWDRGSRICAELRREGDRRPMFLTSHLVTSDDGKELCERCAADAFVPKEPRPILNAIRALASLDLFRPLARARDVTPMYTHAFEDESLEIDVTRGLVIRKHTRLQLSRLEVRTLAYLLRKAPTLVTVADLERDVWQHAVARSAISNVVGDLIARFPGWIEREKRGYRARVRTNLTHH